MGTLAREGFHPDMADDLPVGVWCDAAWSAWTDLMLRIDGPERLDALQEMWDELNAPAPGADSAAGPTMETWGTSDSAQAGAAGLMGMMGGQMPAPPRGGGQ